MGEIADMITEGIICQECMLPLESPPGHPVSCAECGGRAEIATPTKEELEADAEIFGVIMEDRRERKMNKEDGR